MYKRNKAFLIRKKQQEHLRMKYGTGISSKDKTDITETGRGMKNSKGGIKK